MCKVLQLQPAGAFLRRSDDLPLLSSNSDLAVTEGSCSEIDQVPHDKALTSASIQIKSPSKDKPERLLTSICRRIDELGTEASDDEETDTNSDGEEYYYQASSEHTYYSPGLKLSDSSFMSDDAFDLFNTSAASSSLTWWAKQSTDDEHDDMDTLIFQLEL